MDSSSTSGQYDKGISVSATDRVRNIITQVSRMITRDEKEQATVPLSMEYLIAEYSPEKARRGKPVTILCSSAALVSVISSVTLIWIVRRSHIRFSTPYHRLLLGLCIGDIVFSLSNSLYNIWVPREINYFQWNARGSSTTCTIQGFCYAFGLTLSTLYNISMVSGALYKSSSNMNVEPALTIDLCLGRVLLISDQI